MENPTSIYLETHRLLVRSYQPGDGRMYFEAGQRNRQHLQRFESGNSILLPQDEQQAEALIREYSVDGQAGKYDLLGAFEKHSGEFAAQVYLAPTGQGTGEYEIGYIADCRFEGRGYVSEAVRAVLDWLFTTRGARRAVINCSPHNPRSARVAERCGFRLEARLPLHHLTPNGALEDTLVYYLLPGEKKANHRPRHLRPGQVDTEGTEVKRIKKVPKDCKNP